MCEPMHSIVQITDPNESDDKDDDLTGQSGQNRVTTALSNLGQWCRKFGKWLHISKMGAGHSQAIGKVSAAGHNFLYSTMTDYECEWWIRKLRHDGGFHGKSEDKDKAFACAWNYCKAVSVGSLTALRRFLEASIVRSVRAPNYVEAFRKMLSPKGLVQLDKQKKLLDELSKGGELKKQQLTNLLLGFTRKRGLLIPEWADDDSLWR